MGTQGGETGRTKARGMWERGQERGIAGAWMRGGLAEMEAGVGGKKLSKRLANSCQGPKNKQFRLYKPRNTTKEIVCLCLSHVTPPTL